MLMKKYTSVFIFALTLAGCTIEEPVATLNGETEVTMRIQREPDAITRAALAEGNNVVFEAGDKISVFDADGNNCEFSQSGEMGADCSATFSGKVKIVANSYLALYPYIANVAVAEGKIGTVGTDDVRRPVIIPDQQKAVAGGFDPQAFISVAQSVKVSNSVHNITFHNACANVLAPPHTAIHIGRSSFSWARRMRNSLPSESFSVPIFDTPIPLLPYITLLRMYSALGQ